MTDFIRLALVLSAAVASIAIAGCDRGLARPMNYEDCVAPLHTRSELEAGIAACRTLPQKAEQQCREDIANPAAVDGNIKFWGPANQPMLSIYNGLSEPIAGVQVGFLFDDNSTRVYRVYFDGRKIAPLTSAETAMSIFPADLSKTIKSWAITHAFGCGRQG